MGLDMYLYRREYISGHSFNEAPELETFNTLVEAIGIQPSPQAPHIHVEVCVAYWRKANAIHGWFVNELANGVDECQSIYVPREKLVELRDKADAMLRVPANFRENVATKSGLQPTGGFFFGSYDYDDWYIEDMKNTVTQLDKILESTPEDSWSDFIYRASW